MILINREALLSFAKVDADLCASCGDHQTAEDLIMMIKTAPAIDAVPVVRCRECKYHNKPPCPMRLSFNWTDDDDFCSYGEPKEGAD